MRKSNYFNITFLLALVTLVMTACQSTRTIAHGLDEREANEIIVLLERENITAYKLPQAAATGPGGSKVPLWDIAVNSHQAMPAMAILSVNGLPQRQRPNLLDLFTAGGLVPSDLSEQIRYETGLADTLAATIRKIDGIVDTDVILSFPQENPLSITANTTPVTAAVLVIHTGIMDNPNSHLISKIKELVSSAVSGLSYDNVTVVPVRAEVFTPAISFEPTAPKQYVEVWGFTIAQGSLLRFQVFFFCICILLFVLFQGILWLAWKLYPILRQCGGMLQLLNIKPIPDTYAAQTVGGAEENKSKEEKTVPEKPIEPKAQENVEEDVNK